MSVAASPLAGVPFTTMGGDDRSWQDLSNPESYAAYAGMLARSPIPPAERLRCYGYLVRWLVPRVLGRSLLLGEKSFYSPSGTVGVSST